MSASACTRSIPGSISSGFVVQQAVQQNPQQIYTTNPQLVERVEFGLYTHTHLLLAGARR